MLHCSYIRDECWSGAQGQIIRYIACTFIHLSQTLKEKNTWNEHFTAYIRDLDKKKPVIWMGDLNVAPTAIGTRFTSSAVYPSTSYIYSDLANPKSNWNKTPGYTKDETEAFQNILNPPDSAAGVGKFVDVWRQNHPEDKHYTYFSYRFNCRTKGLGWRLDMCMLSIFARWLILNLSP